MTGRLRAAYRKHAARPRPGYLPALDGLRWLMVFSVACFHYWQQSWWAPEVRMLGARVSLDPWLRTGYIWVDGMLLLSGFLLFLPHAQRRVAGGGDIAFPGFYRRRIARIVPSYVLNLLVVFLVVALPERRYATAWQAIRDWLAHLTFTHPWFKFSNLFTPLNGVLWTLGVEVQFYLIFPLVARSFWKRPVMTYLGALAVSFGFRAWAMTQGDSAMLVNQLPAFMDVYLNGFLAAWAYAWLRRHMKDGGMTRLVMTGVTLVSLVVIAWLIRGQAAEKGIQALRNGQMMRRFPLSVLLCLVFIGSSLGLTGIRLLLGNRGARFLSAISFQFYMWHQVVAAQMKRWGFPPSASNQPHMTGELAWQVPYVLLALLISLVISALVTYMIERPLAGRITGKKLRRVLYARPADNQTGSDPGALFLQGEAGGQGVD